MNTAELRLSITADRSGQIHVDEAEQTRRRAKPIEIKQGSVTVRIYKTKWRDKKRRKDYRSHTIIWSDGTGRKREKRATIESARRRARQIAVDLLDGQIAQSQFTESDRASFRRSRELLHAIGDPPLEIAVGIYTESVQILPAGVTPLEAARFYVAQNPAGVLQATIPKTIDEFFARRQMGGKWTRILKKMLERFAAKFAGTMSELRARDIDDWLDSLSAGPARTVNLRTRRNYLKAIAALFTFSKSRGYLRKDWNILSEVSDPNPPPVAVNLYSPEELLRLLNYAESYEAGRKLVPLICITAFAGVRHGEMNEEKAAHLDWSNIDWESKSIFIGKHESKTGNDRVVDMPDNLIAWLKPYARANGRICPLENSSNSLCRLRTKAQIRGPKKNALRKSFISYRTALTRNIEFVADQAGNSPAIIRKNYKRIDTQMKRTAERWFSLMPDRADLLPLFAWTRPA